MSETVLALDVGGANLKAATSAGSVGQRPFALWKRPGELAEALSALVAEFATPPVDRVALTMTGELCDCFVSKRDGVNHIIHATETAVSGRPLSVWLTDGRLATPAEARIAPMLAAASNWHALATYVGRTAGEGFTLLIDTGSTTTDIIPIIDGVPATAGRTDSGRLAAGELVYTGCRRTPVCATLGDAVMAEFFATAQDVYQRLGTLPDEPDDTDTADGRPATASWAHVRLARMLGGDGEVTPAEATYGLAVQAFARQREAIAAGVRAAVARVGRVPDSVLVSGAGEFLAEAGWNEYAAADGVEGVAAVRLSATWGEEMSAVAPAAALAALAT